MQFPEAEGKKCSRPVSRILCFITTKVIKCLPFILTCCHRQVRSGLPPDIGRAILHVGIHDLSTHQAYSLLYYDRSGELLPHLFTLTCLSAGGYFLLRYSALTNSFPLRRMALCVARTFLPSTKGSAADRPAAMLQRYEKSRETSCNKQVFDLVLRSVSTTNKVILY